MLKMKASSAPNLSDFSRASFWKLVDFVSLPSEKGRILGELVRASGKSKVYVRRCLWVSTWPNDLQKRAKERPKIFTARVVLGSFATSMKRLESSGWEGLRKEMERFEKGALSLRKKPKKKETVVQGEVSVSARKQAEDFLREKLRTLVQVTEREVRIRYFSAEELIGVLERFEDET